MATYTINYNPYRNETIIMKNGSKLKRNSSICVGLNAKRLQAWFEADSDWKGLGLTIDEDNNEKECVIEFCGRELDYLDLKEYFEYGYVSSKNTKFTVKSILLSNDSDMLSKLDDLVNDIKQTKLLSDKQVQSIESNIEKLKKEPFAISVIATVSSGKSTLLNALLHRDLLPTGDDATTANIVEIFDNDKSNVELEGFDLSGKLLIERSEATLEKITEINGKKDIRRVKIYGDIPSVNCEKMQLMLRDTPGPNNSEDKNHKEITQSIINDAQNMSTVIYVMNGTQLRVDSDKDLLKSIADEMKKGGKQANDRFFFVINKVDLRLRKPNQTLEGLLDDTKKYLKEFEIDNPRIFPITAGLTCDIWKMRSGYKFDELFELPDIEKNINLFNADSPKVKFEQYASTSFSVKKQLEKDLQEAIDNNDMLEIAFIHSGVKGLEYSLKEYMEKYAYPIKVYDTIQDIKDSIDEEKMRNLFMDKIVKDEKEIKRIKQQIGEIEEKKEERLASRKKFEDELDRYELPNEIEKETSRSVNTAFKDLINKNTAKITSDKLEKKIAVEIVDSLTNETGEIERKLDQEVKAMVNSEVIKKGEEILSQYKKYAEKLEEEITIDNFDFKKIKDIKKYNFDDLKAAAETVTATSDITRDKKEIYLNPNRHWYTPWRPKWLTKDVKEKIGEIEYVDKITVQNEILGVRINAQENVEEILADARNQIVEFKSFFNIQLKNLTETIDAIVEDLNKKTSEENIEEERKKNHQEQLKELDKWVNKINNIVDIVEE